MPKQPRSISGTLTSCARRGAGRSGLVSFALIAALLPRAWGQDRAVSYEEALKLVQQYQGKLVRFRPSIRWLPKGEGLWWSEQRKGRRVYVRIDAKTGARKEGSNAKALGLPGGPALLPVHSRRQLSGRNGERCGVRFENRTKSEVGIFWIDRRGVTKNYGTLAPGASKHISSYAGHAWCLRVTKGGLSTYFVAEPGEGIARIDAAALRKAQAQRKRARQRRVGNRQRVRVRAGHLIVRDKSGKETPLAEGDAKHGPLRGPLQLSPSGRYVFCFQESVVETRKIPLVESSPKGRVQPILHQVPYRKPGDPIPQRRPRLFDLETQKEIPVSARPFEDSYSLRFVKWSSDSKLAYCLYNRRGHQELSLIAIDVTNGKHRYIVREQSQTFIDYSQKTYYAFLPGDRELLWASERDGWNHLYRIDARDGKVLARVTKGPWVLRRVLHVDAKTRTVLFLALGMRKGEDPYHAHLARVDFDGKGLLRLTEGDGNHSVVFNEDRSLFVDRYSRVDQPAITELRRTKDGSLVAELGRDDAKPLFDTGYRVPERFVAKGRDGKTDIHGFLLFPSKLQKGKRYPVLEAIYAGPHSFHVPKDFGTQIGLRRMAELGFIIAKIDGMGTNWRSKAFHDVCWQNLKDAGLPDRIAWLRAAAKKHPELDLTRVGIYGGSAGGQNAMAAVLWHGDFYKAAAADCGCHDNRMDKIWWNEAWMGKLGPHYAASSNAVHASRLTGKLFLTVGELDRNVDPASTLQVVNALIKAKKDFEFYLIPGKGHGAGGAPFFAKKRAEFFQRALGGPVSRR